jgi:hypothetical protein
MCKTNDFPNNQKKSCDKCHYSFCNPCSINHDCEKYAVDDIFGEDDSGMDLFSSEELNLKSKNLASLANDILLIEPASTTVIQVSPETTSTLNAKHVQASAPSVQSPSSISAPLQNTEFTVPLASTTSPQIAISSNTTAKDITESVHQSPTVTITEKAQASTYLNTPITVTKRQGSSVSHTIANNTIAMDTAMAKKLIRDDVDARAERQKTTPRRIPVISSVPANASNNITANNSIQSIGTKRNLKIAAIDADSDDDAGPRRVKKKVDLVAKFFKPNPKLPKFKVETDPVYIRHLDESCSPWIELMVPSTDTIKMSRRVNDINKEIYFRFDLKGSGTRLDNNITFKEHETHADLEVFHILDSDYAGFILEMICVFYQFKLFEYFQFIPSYYSKNKKTDEESKTVHYFESLAGKIPKLGQVRCEKKGSNYIFKLR